jgi:5-methylcytosine-specific restriction endonuclease McrA
MPRLAPKRRWAILTAHGGLCHYCGRKDATHVDHIIPKGCCGSDQPDNLIAACARCNKQKSGRRLPPEKERQAIAAAVSAQPKIEELLRLRTSERLDMIA